MHVLPGAPCSQFIGRRNILSSYQKNHWFTSTQHNSKIKNPSFWHWTFWMITRLTNTSVYYFFCFFVSAIVCLFLVCTILFAWRGWSYPYKMGTYSKQSPQSTRCHICGCRLQWIHWVERSSSSGLGRLADDQIFQLAHWHRGTHLPPTLPRHRSFNENVCVRSDSWITYRIQKETSCSHGTQTWFQR